MSSRRAGEQVVEQQRDWLLARLAAIPNVVPKYTVGNRVLMLKHYDWKADYPATIIRPGRACIIYDGSTRVEYSIQFDEPQTDLTVEACGDCTKFDGTTVLEEWLRPLGDGTPV